MAEKKIVSQHTGGLVGFQIRMTHELHSTLKASALANGRSLNTEIVMILGGDLPPDGRMASLRSGSRPRRDHIAIQAMRSYLSGPLCAELTDADQKSKVVAEVAYAIADAMIEVGDA